MGRGSSMGYMKPSRPGSESKEASAMKLAAIFLVLCIALLGGFGDAFFVDSVAKPVAEPVAALAPAVQAVADRVPSLPLSSYTLLKMVLRSMGIPVEHLIEGSRKCVTELGPEAVGAVKTLLGALTYFG